MSLSKVATVVVTGVLFSSLALAQKAPEQPTYVPNASATVPTVQNNVDYIAGYVQKLQSYKPHGKSAIQKLTELVEKFRAETAEGIARTDSDVQDLAAAVADAAGVLYDIDATSQTISAGVQTLQTSVEGVAAGVQANQQGIQANQKLLGTVVSNEESILAKLAQSQAEAAFYNVENQFASKAYTAALYTPENAKLAREVVETRYKELTGNSKHSQEAREDIGKGVSALNAGDYKNAVNNFGKAYREMVRVNQSPWARSPFSR